MSDPVYFTDDQGRERCLVNPGSFPPVLLTLRHGEWGPPYSPEVQAKIQEEEALARWGRPGPPWWSRLAERVRGWFR